MNTKRVIYVILLSVPLVAVGCTKKRSAREDDEYRPPTISANPGTGIQPAVMATTRVLDRTNAMNELRNIGLLFQDGSPLPKSPDDLTELRRDSPKVFQAIKEGHYVFIWNASRTNPDAILVYWKEVPNQGGPVLRVNGTVDNITAEDFKKAPKAGKLPAAAGTADQVP